MQSAESVLTDRRFLIGCLEDFGKFYDSGFEESGTDEDDSTVLPKLETEDLNEENSVPLDAERAVKV
jgi:hypothetical protein